MVRGMLLATSKAAAGAKKVAAPKVAKKTNVGKKM